MLDPKDDDRVVAIIGDGALTGGMAFEGLNNAGNLDIPFIVVLNDNEMSIAPNVGAMSKYLDRVRTDPRYTRGREDVQSILERLPQGDLLVELGKRWKDSFKEFVYHRMMWEELGFTYLGPVPGHDIRQLVLASGRRNGSTDQCSCTSLPKRDMAIQPPTTTWNAATRYPRRPSREPTAPPVPPKYQDVFARTLIELAQADEKIVGITAAMPTGTSLDKFQKVFPIDSSMSALLSSTRSPLRPVSPPRASSRFAPFIRPFCSVHSIRSCTMSACKSCPSFFRSTAPASPATTAHPSWHLRSQLSPLPPQYDADGFPG